MRERTMRQICVAEGGEVRVEEAPLPSPQDGEVLVRTARVGICGSDLHVLHETHPFMRPPYFPGHEAVGTVEQTGGAEGLNVGDRVVVEPNLVCRKCTNCLSGRYNICDNLRVFGFKTPGALADAFVIRSDRLHHVPRALLDVEAALVEPVAAAVHARRLANDLHEKRVLVLGGGTMGLLTLVLAKLAGAAQVVVTDLLTNKRNTARDLGADAVLNGTDPDLVEKTVEFYGGGADVVFDCVGSVATIDQSWRSAAKGGAVVVIGLPSGRSAVPVPLVQDKELRIQGSMMFVGKDFEAALSLIEQRKIPTEKIATAALPLEKAAEAFRLASEGAHIKVHVVPG